MLLGAIDDGDTFGVVEAGIDALAGCVGFLVGSLVPSRVVALIGGRRLQTALAVLIDIEDDAAAGPDVADAGRIAAFDNIHVYPFLTALLGLRPNPDIDGDAAVLAPALR